MKEKLKSKFKTEIVWRKKAPRHRQNESVAAYISE